MTSLADDPTVRAIAKALYGETVSAVEFAKSLDGSDVHVDQPVGQDQAQPKSKKKLLAAGLVAGAGIEALAAKETLPGLARGIKDVGPAVDEAQGAGAKIRALKPLVTAGPGKVLPMTQGPGTKTALQGGNFVVGLGAAKELTDKNKNPNGTVAKAVVVRIKPVNPAAVRRVPSLRARRAAGSPAVAKGMVRNVKVVTANAAKVSDEAAQAATKVRRLIPNRKAAAALGVTGVAGLGAANGVATYEGAKRGTKAALGKSMVAVGEISKVDEDHRQVFGWANVSVVDGSPVRDRQGDEIDIDELEKAAYDYVLDSRVGGDMHQRVDEGSPIIKFAGVPKHTSDVIESMVFTPEKIEKMGLPPDFTQGWWVGMQVNDEETWQEIKKGRRTGFSVHGTGRRTPLEKRDHERRAVRERARQAMHPPAVKREPTPDSSATASIGYQRQTRKLDVEMRSRPGAPYSYRVKPKVAQKVLTAPSTGRAYTSEIRGKQKHHTRYTAADRARLFASPQ